MKNLLSGLHVPTQLGHISVKQLGFIGITSLAPLLGEETPKEKTRAVMGNLVSNILTMGMGLPRQVLTQTLLEAAHTLPSVIRGLHQGYRSTLEARTMAAIPFSHSTIAMDQAYASMQYAKSRMGEAYSGIGNEATFFAAKYLSRR